MEKKEPHLKEISSRYINRDLSWIEFNRRVLEEAQDAATPLLERTKFLSIVSSNLDEFMSVRVAGIMEQLKVGLTKKDFTGYTPSTLLKKLMKRASKMVAEQYKTFKDILRLLAKEGIKFSGYKELSSSQRKLMDQYYHDIVSPILTPMAVDQSRPFPLLHSQGVYLAVVLQRENEEPDEEPYFAIVQVPSILPRYIHIAARHNSKKQEFVLLEDLIEQHISTLFSGYIPIAVHGFRLTRDADLILNEEGAEDLLEEIEKELRRRRWGIPVRLEVQKGMHPYALDMLKEEFELDEDVFVVDGPIDLSFLMKFVLELPGKDYLRYKRIEPVYPKEFSGADDLFAVLRQQDVLVHHPYESFDAVSDFIYQAAHDPKVLAIKMTLYRVAGNSLLVQSLARAAEAGKQVTVVVELKARFDEEKNIAWAKQLEKAGCHVVYGLVGLKTHSKITLVIRRENDYLRRYVHVGTGNYNDTTARLYTDVGLFTCDPIIGEDASLLFNEITGFSSPRDWQAFGVAPETLQQKLFEYIRREAKLAGEGKKAHMIAKINSLSNQQMIDELYAASQAGVTIELIVRGICSLRPGVEGLSENIKVISVVDRFLEHARIFYFENGGHPEVWLSSADWMTRNLTRRIELMCPILDKELQKTMINILFLSLRDNVKARQLQSGGSYSRVAYGSEPFRSQFAALDISVWKSGRLLNP
ncbi:MAG TPA: polyphosphate kinase 1 [Bacilli bacterium]